MLKNLILLLLTFVCAMLLSCSCENFGLILDGDGVIVVPNFRPSFDDESDWVESERDTEKETEKETNKCSHEWELENAYPEGLIYFSGQGDENGFLSAAALSGRDDMQITVHGNEDRMLLTARFDNLGKGASGAAVQNMNIVLGTDEKTGLVTGGN